MESQDKSKQELEFNAKVNSRLRVIANGSNKVNAIRSITNQCIASHDLLESGEADRISAQISNTLTESSILDDMDDSVKKSGKIVDKKNFKKLPLSLDRPDRVEANVFIELNPNSTLEEAISQALDKDDKDDKGSREIRIKNKRILGNTVKATIVIDDIRKLAKSDNVRAIEGSQNVLLPHLAQILPGKP